MILFVFEGNKVEPRVFDSLSRLFLSDEKVQIISYGNDLPTLYKNLKENGDDLFRVLPFKENGIELIEGKRIDTQISQLFLFFDYDFQNRMGITRLNSILREMLDFFNDETINGKLYINYPMIESLKYVKDLPDINYWQYTVSRSVCVEHRFKGDAERFAYPQARGFRFIDLSSNPPDVVANNWDILMDMNVCKANYVIANSNTIPKKKSDIKQDKLFDAQENKYVKPKDCIAILNSFPLFLYDYLKNGH